VENPLDIGELAEFVGLSARQVERLFREQLGMSPGVFYLKTRLARARTLLRQTVDPVLAVAVECGFASTSHFSHAYKRVFGIPPTKERQSVTARNPGRPRRKTAARRYGGVRR
jgi:transcriptional regulator GlxA family with amidase domain